MFLSLLMSLFALGLVYLIMRDLVFIEDQFHSILRLIINLVLFLSLICARHMSRALWQDAEIHTLII